MSKARQFVDASELSRTAKKPALRATPPSVNYQTIIDGVMEALERDRGRMAEVSTVKTPNSAATSGNRNRKTPPRQGSPAPSNSSAGSSSSRASSTNRTVRFQDQVDVGASNQGYGTSARSRWQGNQSPQGKTPVPGRGWIVVRQDKGPLASSPHRRDVLLRQGGPRVPPPQSGGQWMPGRGGPRFRPPAQGNAGNWRPGSRSSSSDQSGQPPAQQQYPPGQRRWSQGSTNQQPPATANTPPPRRRGCYVCGQPGCHSDFHGPGAVSPQAPPATRSFVCSQRGCYSSRHEAGIQPPAPNVPNQSASPAPRPAMNAANPQSNWQRGSNQGERAPPANVPPRPQSN